MKRLYKSRKNKMLAGVCGGIAEYFDVDPVLVRMVFIVLTIFGGFAVLAYIIGAIIMPYPPAEPGEAGLYSTPQDPQDPQVPQVPRDPRDPRDPAKNNGALIAGVILMVLGAYFLMRNIPLFHDFYWWLHWRIHDFIVPAVLILIGVALLVKGTRKSEN